MKAHRIALAAGLLTLLSAPVGAQLRGGVEQSEPAQAPEPKKTCQDAFAGQDPLSGRPEVMPMENGPDGARCVPPDPSWRLAGQDGNACCYVAPLQTPITGAVVPVGQVRADEARGETCGGNGFDYSGQTAVCSRPTPMQKGGVTQNETSSGGYEYPAPQMVGPSGGVSGSGPSSGAPSGGGKPVTFSTAAMYYGPYTLSAQVPSDLKPGVQRTVNLTQNGNSPFVTALVQVVRQRTARAYGVLKFDSATKADGTVTKLGVTTQY